MSRLNLFLEDAAHRRNFAKGPADLKECRQDGDPLLYQVYVDTTIKNGYTIAKVDRI